MSAPTAEQVAEAWAKAAKKWHFGEYRIGWRSFAAPTAYRTIYPALIPRGAAHIHGIFTAYLPNEDLIHLGVVMSSLIADFLVRARGGTKVDRDRVKDLPNPPFTEMMAAAGFEFLRMNCLTNAYAPIWEDLTGHPWSRDVALRVDLQRQKALAVMDVAVTLSLDIELDTLITLYTALFPVMYKYDKEDLYDVNGRKLPLKFKKLVEQYAPDPPPSKLMQHVMPQSGREVQFEPPYERFDRIAFYKKAATYLQMVEAGLEPYVPLPLFPRDDEFEIYSKE